MERRNILTQGKVLFFLILVNFLAQVPYFFHLYSRSQSWSVSLRSFLIMGAVFAFFLIASFLLFRGHRWGYPWMVAFLSIEFLFYFYGVISSLIHGYGLFFQVHNPDLVLRIIYTIGYMNLFASGYFLYLLLFYRDFFTSRKPPMSVVQS
jgi:hypothetical protein